MNVSKFKIPQPTHALIISHFKYTFKFIMESPKCDLEDDSPRYALWHYGAVPNQKPLMG